MSDSVTPCTVACHGIFQATILEWVTISFSRGSSQPRDQAQVFQVAGRLLTIWAAREVLPAILQRKEEFYLSLNSSLLCSNLVPIPIFKWFQFSTFLSCFSSVSLPKRKYACLYFVINQVNIFTLSSSLGWICWSTWFFIFFIHQH